MKIWEYFLKDLLAQKPSTDLIYLILYGSITVPNSEKIVLHFRDFIFYAMSCYSFITKCMNELIHIFPCLESYKILIFHPND